mgnify:CR=1 FL=1
METQEFWECFNLDDIENFSHEISSFISVSQEKILATAVQKFQEKLEQFEKQHPTASENEKVEYINEKTELNFKGRVANAFQSAGETAFDLFVLENKSLKVIKSAVKGWLNN